MAVASARSQSPKQVAALAETVPVLASDNDAVLDCDNNGAVVGAARARAQQSSYRFPRSGLFSQQHLYSCCETSCSSYPPSCSSCCE